MQQSTRSCSQCTGSVSFFHYRVVNCQHTGLLNFELRVMSYELWAMSYQLRVFNNDFLPNFSQLAWFVEKVEWRKLNWSPNWFAKLWVTSYELWVMSYELWAMSYELRVMSYVFSNNDFLPNFSQLAWFVEKVEWKKLNWRYIRIQLS